MRAPNVVCSMFNRNVLGARSQLLSIRPSIHPLAGIFTERHKLKKGGKVKGGKGGKGENGKVGAGLSGATRLRSCMYVYEVYG